MKNLLAFLLFPLVALSQPVPPPATQAEVDTGVNRYKYVTPFTLANKAGGAGGLTNGYTVQPPLILSGTNISAGVVLSNFSLGGVTYVATNANLQTVFNSIGNSNKIQLGAGIYNVGPSNMSGAILGAAPLILSRKTNVVISGIGNATRIHGVTNGQFISISDCQDITIEGIWFSGTKGGAVNFSSNGIDVVTAVIDIIGTNDWITLKDLKFTDIPVHCINFDNNLGKTTHARCFNLYADGVGCTNVPGTGPDGGLVVGTADDLLISNFETRNVMRAIELFPFPGTISSNIMVINGIMRGIGIAGVHLNCFGKLYGVKLVNLMIEGGRDILPDAGVGDGYKVTFDCANVDFLNCHVYGTKNAGWNLFDGAGTVSNITLTGCSAAGIANGLGFGVTDAVGNGVISDVTFSGCKAIDCFYSGFQVYGGKNIKIVDCEVIDCDRVGTGHYGIKIAENDPTTNIWIKGNFIHNATGVLMEYGIQSDANSRRIIVEDNRIDNMQIAPYQFLNNAEVMVVNPPRLVFPALVAGTYTNDQRDTRIGIPNGSVRTNKLNTPFAGHKVTVVDLGLTASGTNIWCVATSGTINRGTSLTNISINGGAITFEGDGTNWTIVAQGVFTASGGSGTPAGNSGSVQFNEGGTFAGTNDFIFDRTNRNVSIGGLMTNGYNGTHVMIDTVSGTSLFLSASGTEVFQVASSLIPSLRAASGSNTVDLGLWDNSFRSNVVNRLLAKESVSTPTLISGVITQNIANIGAITREVTNNVATNPVPWRETMEISYGGFDPSAGPNQVYRMGWNMDNSGNPITSTRPANFDTWEGNYNPASGDRRLERHMTFSESNGPTLRYFTADKRWSGASVGTVAAAFNVDTFTLFNRSNTFAYLNTLINSPSNATVFLNGGSQLQFSEWTGFNSQLIQIINPATRSVISYDQPNDTLHYGNSTSKTAVEGGGGIDIYNSLSFPFAGKTIGVNNGYPSGITTMGPLNIRTNNGDTGHTIQRTNETLRISGYGSVTINAGQGTSNLVVGGVVAKQITVPAYTNLNTTIATFTNAALWPTPANTLTNDGDSLLVVWRGNMLAGTNNIKAIYGVQTVFDTGNFTNAASSWELGMEITRTGLSTAHADAWLTFNQVGPTLTLYNLSGSGTNLEIAPVHGVLNTNLLQLASNRAGGISNNYMRVYYEPASR